jgi:diadenosine tetraphosphatase ApaH/serine/threonine PP2A family protein phosphatase
MIVNGPVKTYRRIAVFGGVYNNALALAATLEDARRRAVDAVFCLGDMGGFGPHPDRVFPLLRHAGVLADVLLCTHTGIKWHRPLPGGGHAINVGVIGRPENDGSTRVWYAVLTADPVLEVEFVPVRYDHETLARQIEQEGLPPEFAETIRSGWWTTCLENLPTRERARGKH